MEKKLILRLYGKKIINKTINYRIKAINYYEGSNIGISKEYGK